MLFYQKTVKIEEIEKCTPYVFLPKTPKNEKFNLNVSYQNQIFLKNALNFGCLSFGFDFGFGLS